MQSGKPASPPTQPADGPKDPAAAAPHLPEPAKRGAGTPKHPGVFELLKTKTPFGLNETHVFIAADMVFYTLQALLNKNTSRYEIFILASLEVFLLLGKDEKDKLSVFHSLPKVLLIDLHSNILLVLLLLLFLGLQYIQEWNNRGVLTFFLAVTGGVYAVSFGASRVLALGIFLLICLLYMYGWESAEAEHWRSRNEAFGGVEDEQLMHNERDSILKDQAIAQELVAKLKRLKVAMIYEHEKNKKIQTIQKRRQDQKARSRSKSASRGRGEDVTDTEPSTNLEKQDDLVIKNRLDMHELEQLIQILVAQNNQDVKYWLPKDVVSVLNNEEVSAYLWAFLNTQDMARSSHGSKKVKKGSQQKRLQETMIAGLFDDYNHDLFAYDKQNMSIDTLVNGCCLIYSKFDTLNHLGGLPEETMRNFLTSVQSYYFNNYYHNMIHALDVTNSCAFYLNTGFKSLFSHLEVVTLLISATVHDVGHPGFNNAFMVSVGTGQAMIYNDQSVLENYHCSIAFQIIQKDKSNILKSLSKEDRSTFRKNLVNNVLSTDLSKHYLILKKFESQIETGYNLGDEQNRQMALAVALKCGDVGHSSKTLELHKIWSRRVTEEFWNQGDHEARLGIPVTQLCDRKINIAKSQDGFLNFVALPLFEGFGKFIEKHVGPESFSKYNQTCTAQVKKNKEYWLQQALKGEEGNKDFLQETEANLKSFQLHQIPLESLLNLPTASDKE